MSPDYAGTARRRWNGTAVLILGYQPAGLRAARDLALSGVTVDLIGAPPDPDNPLPLIVDLQLAPGLAAPTGRAQLSSQARRWIEQTRSELREYELSGLAHPADVAFHHHRAEHWTPEWLRDAPAEPSDLPGQRWVLRSRSTVFNSVAMTQHLAHQAEAAGATIREQSIETIADVQTLCNEKHYDMVVDALDLEGPDLFGSREALYDIRVVDRYINDAPSTEPFTSVLTDADVAAVIVGPRYTWVTNRVAELQVDRLAIAELTPHDMVDCALDSARDLRPDLLDWFQTHVATRYLWTTSFNGFGGRIHLDNRSDDFPPIAHLWFMGPDASSMFLGAGAELARQVHQYLRDGTVDEDANERPTPR